MMWRYCSRRSCCYADRLNKRDFYADIGMMYVRAKKVAKFNGQEFPELEYS
jgi:hypothetical protein